MQSVARSLSETYSAQPESVARARSAVARFAAEAGVSRRQLDDIRLATSEAVTNAVVHAYGTQPGSVHLTAAIVDDELWVLIADDGFGLQPRSDRPGLGLGLGLIAQVSDDLAIVPRSSGGIELRMRFSLPVAERFRRGRAQRHGGRTHGASASSRR
jgi:anti-sigma regulatory factor (Ser/Thr protein kinase)